MIGIFDLAFFLGFFLLTVGAVYFHWLTAPSSTVLQPSELHTGLCTDPAMTLGALFNRLVA